MLSSYFSLVGNYLPLDFILDAINTHKTCFRIYLLLYCMLMIFAMAFYFDIIEILSLYLLILGSRSVHSHISLQLSIRNNSALSSCILACFIICNSLTFYYITLHYFTDKCIVANIWFQGIHKYIVQLKIKTLSKYWLR